MSLLTSFLSFSDGELTPLMFELSTNNVLSGA